MAVSFTANSAGKITLANPMTFGAGTAFTWYQWWMPTSGPTNGQGTDKDSAQGNDLFVFFNQWFMNVGRASVAAIAHAAGGSTTFTTNTWYFTAGTYDETDGARLFNGTLTTPVAEMSYNGRTVGSGNTLADSSAIYLNNRGAAASNSVPERLALYHFIGRRMSLADLVSHQFCPRVDASSKVFIVPHSTTTIVDWSGRGVSCTPASLAAVVDHVPLGAPFGHTAGWLGAFTTAAAGGGSFVSHLGLLGIG